MYSDEAIREIKANASFLMDRIAEPAKKVSGRQTYICGVNNCGNGSGKDGDGLAADPHRPGLWHCFKCGWSGDIIKYYQETRGKDLKPAVEDLAAMLGITGIIWRNPNAPQKIKATTTANQKTTAATATPQKTQTATETAAETADNLSLTGPQKEPQKEPQAATADYRAYYRYCQDRITDRRAVEYLAARGIGIETAIAYGLGFDPQADPANCPGMIGEGRRLYPTPRIIIPVSKSFFIGRATTADAKLKKANPKGQNVEIFNPKALYGDSKAVFVVEGVFNALSIIQAGHSAIAIHAASDDGILQNLLRVRPTAATLIICLDNDKAGNDGSERLAAKLKELGAIYTIADITGVYNDANERLTADKKGLYEALETAEHEALETRERLLRPDNTLDYLLTGAMQNDVANFKSVPTGFSNWDEVGGGLFSGLYILAASSGTGKTTFALQVCDQLAMQGRDVVFFSLEMSKFEIVSKSLARLCARDEDGIVDTDAARAASSLQIRSGRLSGKQLARLERAKQTYTDKIGRRVSIVEGNFSTTAAKIREITDAYIRRTGSRPVVFVDYLQIIQSDQRQEIRATTDSNVIALKQMARDLNITVICISSTNRASYNAPVSFEALKESSTIEFSADVVLGLDLAAMYEDDVFDADDTKKKKAKAETRSKALDEKPRRIVLHCLKNRYGRMDYKCNFSYWPSSDIIVEDGQWIKDDTTEWDDDEDQGRHRRKKADRRVNGIPVM